MLQGVAKHFREIFAELVPGGKGELVMQKRMHQEVAAEGEEDEDGPDGGHVSEKYSGVKVKVGLLSKVGITSVSFLGSPSGGILWDECNGSHLECMANMHFGILSSTDHFGAAQGMLKCMLGMLHDETIIKVTTCRPSCYSREYSPFHAILHNVLITWRSCVSVHSLCVLPHVIAVRRCHSGRARTW